MSTSRSMPPSIESLAPSARPVGKPVICATALDPDLAERFADDLIRRIDRRARIERERRGM
jgi:hypothetical protein